MFTTLLYHKYFYSLLSKRIKKPIFDIPFVSYVNRHLSNYMIYDMVNFLPTPVTSGPLSNTGIRVSFSN